VSVFLDRLVGISILGILSLAAILLWLMKSKSLGTDYRGAGSESVVTVLLPFAAIIVIATLFWPILYTSLAPIVSRVVPAKLKPWTERVFSAVDVFRSSRGTIIRTGIVTLLAQALFVLVVWVVAGAVSTNRVLVEDCFIAHQVASIASTIPLTPGGIGLRDVGMALTLESLNPGLGSAAAIAVIVTGIIVFWRLIGGIVFALTIVVWPSDLGTRFSKNRGTDDLIGN
jgi:uncharacterized membrane protein YbhN (UPF0104 family)